jgi:hypothetical protein
MTHGFVLTQQQGDIGHVGWERTQAFISVTGSVEELTSRLRPWALETLSWLKYGNGIYIAYLVEVDADGGYDTYLSLEVEDIVWFYEQEYVPAP